MYLQGLISVPELVQKTCGKECDYNIKKDVQKQTLKREAINFHLFSKTTMKESWGATQTWYLTYDQEFATANSYLHQLTRFSII